MALWFLLFSFLFPLFYLPHNLTPSSALSLLSFLSHIILLLLSPTTSYIFFSHLCYFPYPFNFFFYFFQLFPSRSSFLSFIILATLPSPLLLFFYPSLIQSLPFSHIFYFTHFIFFPSFLSVISLSQLFLSLYFSHNFSSSPSLISLSFFFPFLFLSPTDTLIISQPWDEGGKVINIYIYDPKGNQTEQKGIELGFATVAIFPRPFFHFFH